MFNFKKVREFFEQKVTITVSYRTLHVSLVPRVSGFCLLVGEAICLLYK